MTLLPFLASLAAFLGLTGAGEPRAVSRITVEQTTIFRIPVRRHPNAPMIEWREDKGPKCLPVGAIAGAMLAGPGSIDFVLRDRQRIRAKVDADCTALDFYAGFYVQPEDTRLCAKRDAIRSRMGASCAIRKFRTLQPVFQR